MSKMLIKKNDTVVLISGKDKGKSGKVLKVIPEKNRVVVEKLNPRPVTIRTLDINGDKAIGNNTWTILIPVLGALLIAIVPKDRHTLMKGIALVASLILFVMGMAIWFGFDPDTAAFQFGRRRVILRSPASNDELASYEYSLPVNLAGGPGASAP